MPLCSLPKHTTLPQTKLEKKLGCNQSARLSPTDPRGSGPASGNLPLTPRRRAIHSLHYGELKLRGKCGDHPKPVMVAIQCAGLGVGLFAFLWSVSTLLDAIAGGRA